MRQNLSDAFNQYDAQKGGSQNFRAFLPSRAMDFDVQVERTATPTFEIGGKQVATERYRIVSSSGLILDAWTDLSRTPLLILLEAQGVKVVRQGLEGLAEVVSKPEVAEGYLSEEVTFLNEEVTFLNGDVSLAGTITIPRGGDKRRPAALLISGSGSQDRDGNPGVFSF
jgi:hypothetical protein